MEETESIPTQEPSKENTIPKNNDKKYQLIASLCFVAHLAIFLALLLGAINIDGLETTPFLLITLFFSCFKLIGQVIWYRWIITILLIIVYFIITILIGINVYISGKDFIKIFGKCNYKKLFSKKIYDDTLKDFKVFVLFVILFAMSMFETTPSTVTIILLAIMCIVNTVCEYILCQIRAERKNNTLRNCAYRAINIGLIILLVVLLTKPCIIEVFDGIKLLTSGATHQKDILAILGLLYTLICSPILYIVLVFSFIYKFFYKQNTSFGKIIIYIFVITFFDLIFDIYLNNLYTDIETEVVLSWLKICIKPYLPLIFVILIQFISNKFLLTEKQA